MKTRQQLTLFLRDKSDMIERLRHKYNPIQYDLIPAHVTLCREDEIIDIGKVIENLKSINNSLPIKIKFSVVKRFCKNKGLYLPASVENTTFKELRRRVLTDIDSNPRNHQPHITIVHPRNATCTDDIYNEVRHQTLPKVLVFDCISLIEQCNDQKWSILNEFHSTKQQ